jgi:hypothetical protein
VCIVGREVGITEAFKMYTTVSLLIGMALENLRETFSRLPISA